MGRRVFITGMIRSGTTLAQTLLTNHPDAFGVYQPFHQLYIDVEAVLPRIPWHRSFPSPWRRNGRDRRRAGGLLQVARDSPIR